MSGTGVDPLFVYDPTATQFEALVHDTPLSPTKVPPAGCGVSSSVQAEPFHDSVSAQFTWLLSVYEPTAMHCDALVQEIALRTLDDAVGGLGVGSTRHAVPFHDSVSAWTTSLVL